MNCACASQSATLEKFPKIFQDLSDKNKMVAKSGGAGHTRWKGVGGGGTPYKGVIREGSALKGYLFQASGI